MSEAQTPTLATGKMQPHRPGPATLSGVLGLRDADGIRRDLAKLIEAGGPVRVDVQGVTAADISIIQILLAAARSSARRNCVLELSGLDESPLPGLMTAIGLCAPDAADTDFHDILTRGNTPGEDG